MRRAAWLFALLAALVAGCALTPGNSPRNVPTNPDAAAPGPQLAPIDIADDTAVAVAFSGGGLRAAAFAFGVLQGLEAASGREGRTLLDDLTFITSVSGGSITAAYFALHGKQMLPTFRDRVLVSDGEARLRFSLWNPVNVSRLLSGGLNDREDLRGWLEDEVFKGATYADIFRRGRPELWINASNIYHRMPFPFHDRAFAALCSDLSRFPVSEAVYASMAVPIVFAPVILEKHLESCREPVPAWVEEALRDPATPLALRATARAFRDFRSAKTGRYVKLVDGGLTDNYGLAAILHSRLALGTLHGPLTDGEAVRLRQMLFIVVDAGQGPSGDWNRELGGPSALTLATASIDTALEANVRLSYDGFVPMMRSWRDDVVRYRCGLDAAAVRRMLGPGREWRCDDLKFFVTRLSFDHFDAERSRALSAIPTRLVLPAADVDRLIAAGREAVVTDRSVRGFREAIPR